MSEPAGSSSARWWLEVAGAAALYGGLAVVATWPLAVESAALPGGADNLHLAWVLAWVQRTILEPGRGIFAAPSFHPVDHALAFSDPNVSTALMLLPVRPFTAEPVALLALHALVSFVFCGLATFLLVRSWTGSARGALAAGLLFAFSPLRFSHADHLQLFAFWWLPVALLGLVRFLRTGTWGAIALLAIGVTGQIYASIYLTVFTIAALVVYAGLALVTGRVAISWRKMLMGGAVAVGLTLLLAAPLVRAYADVRLTWGASRSLEQNVRYSAAPAAFLSAHPGNLVWGRLLAPFEDPVAPWEKYLFFGLVPLGLAIGSLGRDRSGLVPFGLVVLAGGAIAALGPHLRWAGVDTGVPLPYLAAMETFPPLAALRAPARWALLASFGLALAAAPAAARLRPSLLAAVLALAVAEAAVAPFVHGKAPHAGGVPPVYRWLAASGEGPLVEIPLAKTDEERRRVEVPRLYFSTVHWRPLVNGYSGYTPSPYRALVRLLERGDPEPVLPVLAAWGVRTIVVHLDELDETRRRSWLDLAASSLVDETFASEGVRVLEIRGPDPGFPATRVRLAGTPALAPTERATVDVAFEALDDPVPLRPSVMGWHRATARWADPEGRVVTGWAKAYCPPLVDPSDPGETWFVDPPDAQGWYHLEIEGRCGTAAGAVEVAVARESKE